MVNKLQTAQQIGGISAHYKLVIEHQAKDHGNALFVWEDIEVKRKSSSVCWMSLCEKLQKNLFFWRKK
ncbi:hypothetical protein HOO54_04060 [Bacillus sp. WMMC1349]|uniref:YcdB/YcdC domain-containing protein n=1 Tax=Bacillus sp. WMMC1349 TaxID=2736254 RepID=UPI001552F809|nr:YcdB/YcdC domain-containing protein [Bacillus sp. WMMC1349]NPC91439.1 hypothetical protein [Bacillus sp. WMMC1349]